MACLTAPLDSVARNDLVGTQYLTQLLGEGPSRQGKRAEGEQC